jgi:hypothetical protein
MGTTFGLHHILFPHPGLYPLTLRLTYPPPPSHGGKIWTSAQTNVTYPGSSNMLEFFNFEKKNRKKIWAAKGGNDEFFFGKITHVFGDTPPLKKGGESISEGIFF